MSDLPASQGYSAQVCLELRTPHGNVPLLRVGPDHVVARDPQGMPPCNASVVMNVDGREHAWPVTLPDGISTDSPLVATSKSAPSSVTW